MGEWRMLCNMTCAVCFPLANTRNLRLAICIELGEQLYSFSFLAWNVDCLFVLVL